MVEPKSSRQKSKTQDQHIYEEIFDAILEQRLWPGTRLKEESLGEIFGVSRTIIRRTLSRLAHERVAVFEPNRGAFVAEPDVSDARQILDARRLMELAIVERVAARASSIRGEFKKLYDLIEQEHKSSAAADKGTAIRLSGEFHLELARLSGNKPLEDFLRSLVPQTSLIIALYQSKEGSSCAIDEHSRLLDALKLGDAPEAKRLMGEHLDHIEERLALDGSPGNRNLAKVFGRQVGKTGA